MPATPLPLITTQSVVGVTVVGSLHGQTTLNRFSFMSLDGTPILQSELAGVGTMFQNDTLVAFTDLISIDWTCIALVVELIGYPALAAYQFTPKREDLTLYKGFFVEEACPATVAVSIARFTGVRGRRGRGRVQIPGLPKVHAVDSRLKESERAAWNAVWAGQSALMNWTRPGGGAGPALKPCLAFYGSIVQGVGEPPALRAAPLTSWKPNFVLGTANRRKYGRGI